MLIAKLFACNRKFFCYFIVILSDLYIFAVDYYFFVVNYYFSSKENFPILLLGGNHTDEVAEIKSLAAKHTFADRLRC